MYAFHVGPRAGVGMERHSARKKLAAELPARVGMRVNTKGGGARYDTNAIPVL